MIAENDFVFNRKAEFKNSKYIIVAKLEKANTAASSSWEGQVGSLKTFFSDIIHNTKQDQKQLMEQMKEEMATNYRGLD